MPAGTISRQKAGTPQQGRLLFRQPRLEPRRFQGCPPSPPGICFTCAASERTRPRCRSSCGRPSQSRKQGCLKAIRAESLEVNERLQPIKLATSACSDSSSRVRLQHWEAWDGDWGGGAALRLQLAVITQRSTGRSPSFYKTSVFMDLPASRTSGPQPAASRIILHLTARSIHNM